MFTETSRGLGRGEPVMDLLLGLIKPSSYAGANKRVKARMDFPYSGNKRLLHHPVKVRYFVVWSQGSVCSSHLKTEQRISIDSFQVSYLKIRTALYAKRHWFYIYFSLVLHRSRSKKTTFFHRKNHLFVPPIMDCKFQTHILS